LQSKLWMRSALGATPLVLAATLMFTMGCYAQTSGPTTVNTTSQAQGISVAGEGRLTATPDVAVLTLGVEVTAASVDQAYQDANKAMDGVIAALKTAGLAEKDYKTTQFNINIIRRTVNGEDTIQGYRVNNQVSAKVRPVASAGKVLTQVTAAAGNAARVQGIQLTLDDPAKLQTQLRDLAMADARAKADQLAARAGVKAGVPISIQDGGTPVTPRPLDLPTAALARGAASDAPINPGELEVRQTVAVTYAIVP